MKAEGREPIIPHIPGAEDGERATVPDDNAASDELTSENGIILRE